MSTVVNNIPRFRRLPTLIALLFLIPAQLFTLVTKGAEFERLIIFGDSLSDTGNLAGATFNLPFPFYMNRISDGPVAVDFLATEVGLATNAAEHLLGSAKGDNYAVAGGNIVGNDFEDLSSQVNAFLLNNTSVGSDSLVLFFMGGNDLRGISLETSALIRNALITQAVDELEDQIDRVVALGARRIIVANSPNIASIPESANRAISNPGYLDRADETSRSFKRLLEVRFSSSGSAAAEFQIADVFSVVETIFANPSAFGFTNSTDGCFVEFDFHPDCNIGFSFDRFVFFDNIHPTSNAHRIVSQALIDAAGRFGTGSNVSASVVPAIQLLLLGE
ncbi:MAG: SGNH/GDSL hydrolase family protein [Pseudomonadota bacterium]